MTEHLVEHVKTPKETEKARDPAETTKTRSELLLEEYDNDTTIMATALV